MNLCLGFLVLESNSPDLLSDRNKYIIMHLRSWSRYSILYIGHPDNTSSCASLTVQASNACLSLVVQFIFLLNFLRREYNLLHQIDFVACRIAVGA